MSNPNNQSPPRVDRGILAWLAPLYQSGASLRFWIRTLRDNAGRIHWRCWLLIPFTTVIIAIGSLLGWLSRLVFSRAVHQTPMAGPPIFVIGHWRSGTTMLHELISLDPRLAFPSNYECFQPNHFLLTGPVVHWLSKFASPQKRPMDDMKATMSSPGEDEAVLRSMGVASIYNNLCFPSRADEVSARLDLLSLPFDELERWKRVFTRFMRQLNFRYGRPLVLKSPTHTAHVEILLELYPDARFINIVRDPREVHASTMKLWRTLMNLVSLEQTVGLPEERLFATHRLMHERLKQARPLVPDCQFCETRFETLTADPVGEISRIYSELGLGEYEGMKARIEGYFAERREVRASRYEWSQEQRVRDEAELASVIADNGYFKAGSEPAA